MARKSRKKDKSDTSSASKEKIYKTAIYTRLSIMDIRDRKDSTTLEMQQKLLENYIKNKPFLKLTAVYTDNGETGINFNRPGFIKLMNDISKGKIDCLVVKDLSRLGRNHLEAGNYIENVFPAYGLRFISVNDNYDSLTNSGDEILIVALKNLMNELYALDIAQKVTSALVVKQKEGKFIGDFAAYGYLKAPDNKNKIIVDEETAPVVRDIFKWKLEGMSFNAITRKLNELKIPSPSAYRYSKGIIKNDRLGNSIWQVMTVKNILQHPVYLGHLVQGRKKSGIMQGVHQRIVPRDKWVIVENTHEPIIDHTVFEEVQSLIAKQTEIYNKNKGKYAHLGNPENILKGLVYCAKCGRNLVRYKNVTHGGTKAHYTFICPNHAVNLEHGCPMSECIHEVVLLDAILKIVINELHIANAAVDAIKKLNNSKKIETLMTKNKGETSRIKKELERLTNLKNSLYESYKDNILDEDEYEYAKKKYTLDIENLRQKLEAFEAERHKFSDSYVESNKWVNLFQGFKSEPTLTKALLNELIDMIIVHSETQIEVSFSYKDEKQELLRHVMDNIPARRAVL